MTKTEKPVETLSRAINTAPKQVTLQGKKAYLHPIPWIEQLVLDASIQEFLMVAKRRALTENAVRTLMTQVVAIGTLQMSLKTSEEPDSDVVYNSLEEAYNELKNNPAEVWAAYDTYVTAFEIAPEEKKS